MRTPITLISGPLGSGKTTLLRHILATSPAGLAILMNEFGEIAIDSKVVEGRNIRIVELNGGCVCCSLIGEFEAAVQELIDMVDPDRIVVETTGLAEPEVLVFDIQGSLPETRLDGVITVADADAMVRFPLLGHTTSMQIEAADIVLLNKADLVSPLDVRMLRDKLARLNSLAPVILTERSRVDPHLLFGFGREREVKPPAALHESGWESFSYTTEGPLDRGCFARFADGLVEDLYRAKGFVRFAEGTYLFNFVAGRWELEPFEAEGTALVFIGERLKRREPKILSEIRKCYGHTSTPPSTEGSNENGRVQGPVAIA